MQIFKIFDILYFLYNGGKHRKKTSCVLVPLQLGRSVKIMTKKKNIIMMKS